MPSGCPVCEQQIALSATRCSTCGYPTALALDAMRALSQEGPVPPAPAALADRPTVRRRALRARDPQEELVAKLAQQIEAEVQVLQWMGAEPREAMADLRQAALAEADGRVREALDVLRHSLEMVGERALHFFERRVVELEERDGRLAKSGVRTGLTAEIAQARQRFRAGQREDAIQLLRNAGTTLARIEGDWKGLLDLLQQVEPLRAAARDAGVDLAAVDTDFAEIRASLSDQSLTVEALDRASQTAARAMATLRDHLPIAIEAELGRHETVLRALPLEATSGGSARELHAEAVRHLRRGRLPEATETLKQLRAAIRALAPPAAPAAPPPHPPSPTPTAPPSSGPTEARPSPEQLSRLLERARNLAARVRSLPHDSEIAFEAAGEIRRATELLRAGKLDGAESTLARLMRTLDAEGGHGRAEGR